MKNNFDVADGSCHHLKLFFPEYSVSESLRKKIRFLIDQGLNTFAFAIAIQSRCLNLGFKVVLYLGHFELS